MSRIEFTEASWSEIAPQALALGVMHSEEVDAGIESRRKYQLDETLMARAHELGFIRIYAAWIGEKLVGYCTWNVSLDIESKGLLIATQGAWYMHPESAGSGTRLFKFSLAQLKALGVQCVFPHHRTQGRGRPERLGPFFERLGAVRHQIDYTLWIGD